MREVLIRALGDAITSVVLAPCCACCSGRLEFPTRGAVCAACWSAVPQPAGPLCRICGDALVSWRHAGSERTCARCARSPRVISIGRSIGPYEGTLRDILFARPAPALAFLKLIDRGDCAGQEVPVDELRHLASHGSNEIDELLRKHWGNLGPGTPEEKLATMRRFNNDLRAAPGNPESGHVLFKKHCGTCHELHGEGERIAPNLTIANRQDLAALLANIVDPSAVIRREYFSYVVTTTSGRVITGLIAEQDGATLTIVTSDSKRVKLSRDEIDDITESQISQMPDKILDNLTPQELRDLFSYLQK